MSLPDEATGRAPLRIGLLVLKASTGAGGLETYELEIVRALARIDPHNAYHVICAAPVDPGCFGITQPNFTFHALKPASRWLALTWGFRRLARRLRLDLFHVTFVPPLWPGVPYVFTAHGPEMFVNPKFYPWAIRLRMNALIRRAYREAAHVLAVSRATASYLEAHFQVGAARMSVVHNGVDPAFRVRDHAACAAAVSRRFGFQGPFMLVVGRVEPRKNPLRILDAFARCRAQLGPTWRLVYAGDKTWSAGALDAAVARLDLGAQVVTLGHVTQDELLSLYGAASMLVYPSLWEGFGLPIVEAMACGVPVLTANLASMPEVAADAALLVDPGDVDSIARGMLALAGDAALAARLREAGLARARAFSWDAAARQTLDAYEALAARPQPGQAPGLRA